MNRRWGNMMPSICENAVHRQLAIQHCMTNDMANYTTKYTTNYATNDPTG